MRANLRRIDPRSFLGVIALFAASCSVDPALPGTDVVARPDASTAAPTSTRDITPGAPVVADDGEWTRIPIPEGHCRHGGDAYMMVRLNSASKKVAIYEEGGGACFNDSSCTLLNFNPPSYLLGGGIFNFGNDENPIRDWNVFYIPYCTGDVQAGANPSSDVGPITGTTGFNGYGNVRQYLARILATVPDATDYFLAGSSAGGFGAGLTADLVARNAPETVERFTLVDDSGMPLGETYLPPCLQSTWREVWGFDQSFLAYCGDACPHDDVFVTDYVHYILDRYAADDSSDRFVGGFISTTGDAIMRTFFGYGSNECGQFAPLTKATFSAGLTDLRSTIATRTNRVGTFFFDGSVHTTLIADSAISVGGVGIGGLYDTEVDGVRLVDWLTDLIERRRSSHVGP